MDVNPRRLERVRPVGGESPHCLTCGRPEPASGSRAAADPLREWLATRSITAAELLRSGA